MAEGISPTEDVVVRLAALGSWCLAQSRDGFGDVDAGSLQDEAERLGVLERVHVTEPCGENCACAEIDDFPQECLRPTDAAATIMRLTGNL